MSKIKVNKNKNYTVMSNYHFKEKEMSLKAKGLLSEMLSLPDNWDYSIAGLVAINKENESAIKSTLDELKEFGYLIVTKLMPNETTTGRYEYIYEIYEKPQKQEGKKQGVENLGVEILGVENQGQYNTNNKILNNKINNNITTTIYDVVEQNFNRTLTPIEYQKIEEWLLYYQPNIIRYAIEKAVYNNKKTFSYVSGILNNWKTMGYNTIEEIKNNEEIQQANQSFNKTKKVEVTPNWLNENIEQDLASEEEINDLEKRLNEIRSN